MRFELDAKPKIAAAQWSKVVDGTNVASRATVQREMRRLLVDHYGKDADIAVRMIAPHPVRIDRGSYPRALGEISVDGRYAGLVTADATKGNVRAALNVGQSEFEAGIAVKQARAARSTQTAASPLHVVPLAEAVKPAVYAMGVGNTLVSVDGQVPGFTVPKALANNPFTAGWMAFVTNAMGFTRVE